MIVPHRGIKIIKKRFYHLASSPCRLVFNAFVSCVIISCSAIMQMFVGFFPFFFALLLRLHKTGTLVLNWRDATLFYGDTLIWF